MPDAPRPVMLAILDGFGWREESADNAVRQARKPNFDRLWQTCPHAFLHASGARCRAARRADGQLRGRPHEHRRRPRGDAGPAADRRGAGRRRAAELPAFRDLVGEAAGVRRHLPPAWGWCRRAGCIRTRRTPRRLRARSRRPASRSRCTPSPTGATRRRAPRAGYLAAAASGAARTGARDRHRLAAATTRWTATSAGTAWPRPTRRSSRRGPRYADAPSGHRRRPTRATRTTSSSSPPLVGDRAVGPIARRRRASSSSTSARTARGRLSRALHRAGPSPASRARSASARRTSSA